jgi:hypothetical protein
VRAAGVPPLPRVPYSPQFSKCLSRPQVVNGRVERKIKQPLQAIHNLVASERRARADSPAGGGQVAPAPTSTAPKAFNTPSSPRAEEPKGSKFDNSRPSPAGHESHD